MFIQGCGNNRGAFNAGLHSYVNGYTAPNECVELYGIFERKIGGDLYKKSWLSRTANLT